MAPSGSVKCIVRGDTINSRTNASTNFCSDCKKPCHTKCAGKRKDAPCDLCRAIEQQRQKKYDVLQQKRLSAEPTLKPVASSTSPESKGEGVSSATDELSTSIRPTQLPRSRLSVFTPSPIDPGKRRQTLPPSKGLTIMNNIPCNTLLDTTPKQNDSDSNLILNYKNAQKSGASTVAGQLSMINTSISSLSSSFTATIEPLSRKLDDLGVSVNYLPALQTQISTVCDGFRELDSLVRTQNSLLVELQSKQCDLMEENS